MGLIKGLSYFYILEPEESFDFYMFNNHIRGLNVLKLKLKYVKIFKEMVLKYIYICFNRVNSKF